MRKHNMKVWCEGTKTLSYLTPERAVFVSQHRGDYKILEGTGAHDKNGDEIFEGDILMFNGCIWVMTWLESVVGFMFKLVTPNKDLCMTFFTDCMSERCEIIGNIFTTPELLEATNEI